MANLRKSKQKEKAGRGLSATASVVHPADFPVGSLKSHAAEENAPWGSRR